MRKLSLVTAALLAFSPAAATEWFAINGGGRTLEAGCLPTPGTASDVIAHLTRHLTDVDIISDGSTDGMRVYATGRTIAEPIIHATGKDSATGEQVQISASTLAGCMESLAMREAADHFERFELVEGIPEYKARVADNVRQLRAGKTILPYVRRKPITGYVSNASVTAYLYDTDCPDGAGRQAQIVNDGPPMITGCWNEIGGRIVVEWQVMIEPGRMVTLPRGEYIDTFDKDAVDNPG